MNFPDSKKHEKKQSLQKRYECNYCRKTYKNKCHLSRHMNYECLLKIQKNRPKHKCSDCHVYFTTKYAMQRHYGSKHLYGGERTSCDVCRKTFHDQKTLKRHFLQSNCNGTPTTTFTCKVRISKKKIKILVYSTVQTCLSRHYAKYQE